MNIFIFTAHFGKEEDCRDHFKAQRDINKGLFAKNVAVHPIIGLRVNGAMHARNVSQIQVRSATVHLIKFNL